MSMSQATQELANRPSVRDGLEDRSEMAKVLGVTERTVIRYERLGMPFIAVGRLRLYDVSKVRAWLMSHEKNHAAPRRGRPRNSTNN